MQGVLRTSGKPAKIKLRATVKGLPAGAEVEITDLMLQPDQAVSGWLPHVTELPWSAGIVPDEGSDNVYFRLSALEAEVASQRAALVPITSPMQSWRGNNPTDSGHVVTEWDSNLGWVSWINLESLPATGDIGFWFPFDSSVQSAARPSRFTVTLISESVSGIGSLRPRIDLMNAGAVDRATAEVMLDVWPDWEYPVSHDFILSANRAARPAFQVVGRTAGATGRIGLTVPFVGTPSVRSE